MVDATGNLAIAVEPRYACSVIRADRVIPAVLSDVIRKAPLCPEKVDFAWRTAVGPSLARATTVRLDDHGVLRVTTEDAQWTIEVKRSSRLILARLATLLGSDVARTIQVISSRGTGR
jgi:hypothetical protein